MRFKITHQTTGRYCELQDIPEESRLAQGMDFRFPTYRREVFLRFYEFHLKYNSHPGCVYFAFPWLADYHSMTMEQKLWFAFINGCSQNVVSTWLIYKQFPSIKDLIVSELDDWWNKNHQHFKAGSGWDSDRKYFKIGKTGFPQCVEVYQKHVKRYGSQLDMFNAIGTSADPYKNFNLIWDYVRQNFLSFGRLSTFSYLEYLRIQGLNLDCDSLFLEDMSGSKSHRNGLCKVLGRDDLDWHDTINPEFDGTYTPQMLDWLREEGQNLLDEARERIKHKDVSYFTLESTFCCYKSWHRPNRRYPNVYVDMFHDRIKYAESEWPEQDFTLFWNMRRENLPKNLRLEDNPGDPGLSKEKQNHYRLTGQVIMMDKDWPVFKNDFNDKVDQNISIESFFS